MRNVLLGMLGVAVWCMTSTNGAAHAPASGLDLSPLHARVAVFGAPGHCGMCGPDGDCSIRAALDRPPRPAPDLGHFGAAPEIVNAIDAASAMTNVDFEYLLRSAALESSFNPALEATTSTAVGLYQFLEQSWLYMLREVGAALGLEDLAEAISEGENGYEVADEEAREEILSLRYDVRLSAVLAGLFTRRNYDALARKLEREPDAGELYLAHVMGATGAAKLIGLMAEQPRAAARKHFPHAARANRAVFFHRNGKPRSVAEVYDFLTGKYRGIPVHAAPSLLWYMRFPRWQIGGDDAHYAMR